MTISKITDNQRLEELTEWCRNKPDEAAIRIMVAEGVGVEPMGRDKGCSVSFKGEPVEGMEYSGVEVTGGWKPSTPWISVKLIETIEDGCGVGRAGSTHLPKPRRYIVEPKTSEDQRRLYGSFVGREVVTIGGKEYMVVSVKGSRFEVVEFVRVDTPGA